MIFYGRHYKGETDDLPPERRQLRRVPRVLASAFRLVWAAALGRFVLSLIPQTIGAVITGAQLIITRDLIAAVLATSGGGDVARSGRSVLLISHRFSSVRSADRIYVLHEGQMVEHGTHEQLMQLDGRYAELCTMQASAYFPELMKIQAKPA